MEWNRKLIAALLAVCLLCGIAEPAMAVSAPMMDAYYADCKYRDIAVSNYARMLLYKRGNGVVAAADSSGKYGLMDMTGNPVTGFVYQEMYVLGGGLFKFQDAAGKWGVIDYTGAVKLTLESGYYNSISCYNNTIEVINGGGTQYYTLDWAPATVADYYGYGTGRGSNSAAGRSTFLTSYKAWDYMWTSSGDYKYKVQSRTDDKWGVVDENNQVIVPLQYDSKDRISDENQNGYIAASLTDSHTDIYANSSATPVQTFDHWIGTASYYRDFSFRGADGKYGIKKLDGTVVLSAQYDAILTDGYDHLLTMTNSGTIANYGLYTYDGDRIFADVYSRISCVGHIETSGLGYLLGKDSKYGTATVSGTSVTNGIPLEYDNMEYYNSNFVQCEKDGRFIVHSFGGETILPWSDAVPVNFASELNNPSSPLSSGLMAYYMPAGYDGGAASDGYMPFVIRTSSTESGYATYYLNAVTGAVRGYLPYRASNVNDEGYFVYQDTSGNYGLAGLYQMPGEDGTIKLEEGVRYVPYSCRAEEESFTETPETPGWELLRYELVGTLPSGLSLDPYTAVISGVPMASGTWNFTVRRILPHPDQGDDAASILELPCSLTVQSNTDTAVQRPNDYIITDPVGTPDPNNRDHFYKMDYAEETLVISGPYADFYRLRIDGVELFEPQDYTSREGSTVITLRTQTFQRFGEGTHTISAEYREARNPNSALKRVAQNYTLTISRPSGGDSGGDSGRDSGSGANKPGNQQTQTTPADSGLPFLDVSPSDWFYPDLVWAYENGIMFGYPDRTFRPQNQVSQATIVAVLSRLAKVDLTRFEGETEPGIPTGQTFTAAAIWAKRAGLLPEEGGFTGSEAISRNQMAVMLVKYLLSMGQDTTPPAQPIIFADAADMSQEGNDAFQILYQQNIFRGVGGMNMNATGTTTRAHFVALVHRIYETAVSGG